jgi:CBS domain containing-hemolysin-like protein
MLPARLLGPQEDDTRAKDGAGPIARPRSQERIEMPGSDGGMLNVLGVLAVLVLVAANGFFVASEFSLVAVRRSRVAELVAAGRTNANALKRAVDSLDANLAATQLGITISSLALGWIGEPALAHLVEPYVSRLGQLGGFQAAATSHVIAITIAFVLITALHIVLGELAPKSLALQRSEKTALWVVRPLGLFLFLLWPAIVSLNGLGNLVLKAAGLRPGAGEGSVHSPEELRLLIAASQEAGILHEAQKEVVVRALGISERRIGDIMTPRTEVDWIDADDSRDEILRTIRACLHEQLLVGRGDIDEPLGMVLKKDPLCCTRRSPCSGRWSSSAKLRYGWPSSSMNMAAFRVSSRRRTCSARLPDTCLMPRARSPTSSSARMVRS